MSEDTCSHDCDHCSQKCESQPGDFIEKPHELSHIKKVIAIVSGKGGVGKSLVTSLLAIALQKKGHKTAILDADITGPSIPKAFGITDRASGNAQGIYPAESKTGIRIMSINLLLEHETDAVVWRGPILAGAVKQFWKDVIWGDLDFLLVDMPPGTGDVPLTVFQSLPIDGIIVVTSPQELVSMIVGKALNMADLMKVPVLGLVENMSYFECPDNGKRYQIFGESHLDEIAQRHKLSILGRLPIQPQVARACDQGAVESLSGDELQAARSLLENLLAKE